jgi:hypothetical protein
MRRGGHVTERWSRAAQTWALAAVLVSTAAPVARADAEAPTSPEAAPAPLFDCISSAERARAARVAELRADPEAFRPTAVRLPPFFLTNPEGTFTWAGLVYLRVSDHEGGTRTRLVAPLFLSHCAPGSHTLVTPLYGQRVDAEGTARLTLGWFSRRDRLAETDALFPFFWSIREREAQGGPVVRRHGAVPPFVFWGSDDRTGAHHTFVPPLYWRWSDGARDTFIAGPLFRTRTKDAWHAGLAPLYFTGERRGARYHLVPPLLFYRSVGEDRSTTLFPLGWYDRDPDGFSLAVLPFLVAGRDARAGTHHTFVPPLYFRWGSEQVTTTIVGNVFWREREQSAHFGVVPFYFSGTDEGGWYQALPPLVWRWGDHAGERQTTIAGPFYGHRTPGSRHLGALPFWLGGEVQGRRYDVIPPLLFARRQTEDGHELLAGNTWLRTRPDGFTLASVPLVFAGREGKRHYTLVPPLLTYHGGDGETETTWVVNTGYQRRPGGFTFGVAPLLLVHREGEHRTTVAGNVYLRTTPARTDLGVVPFYFRGRAGASYYDVAPPFFWRFGDERVRTLVAGLYFRRQDERGYHTGVAPLWFGSERDGVRTDLVLPLLTYLQRRKDGFTFTAFPFVFAGREGKRHHALVPPLLTWHDGDGETETTLVANTFLRTAPRGHTFRFFPLVWSGRDGKSHHLHVPPLFWRWGDEEETTTIAGPMFWRKVPTGRDFGLAPLYFGGRHGDRYYDVVLPLFARWGDKDQRRTALFVPGYHFRTDVGWHAGVLPFWFGGRDETGRYDLVPPLLFYRGHNAAKGRTRVAALNTFVETRPDGHTVASVPFVFSHREGARHRWLIPPLLTYHSGDGQTETTFAVNTWYQRRPDGFTLTSAPLLHVHRAKNRHRTFVAPLFWRWGDDEQTTTLAGNVFLRQTPQAQHLSVFPFFFRGRHEGNHYTVIPPLLAAHVGDAETETTWVLNTVHQKRKDGFTLTSVPFAHVHRSPDRQRTFVPPLYWHWGSAGESTTLAGNVYLRTAPGERQLTVFPFLFHGQKGAAHHTWVPPLLFFHDGDTTRETTYFLNAFHQRDPGGWRFNLFPLVFAARGPTRHHTIVAPLFWRWGDLVSTTTIAGNVFWHERLDRKTFGVAPFYFRTESPGRTRVTLLPLFDWQKGPGPDDRRLISPLVVHSSDALHERTVVAGLYWRFHSPDTDTRVVFPFWWDVRSLHKGTRLSTVFPLYWRYQTPEETTHLLGNAMWSRGQTERGPSWSFHLFPFVDVASYHPDHLLWQVLAGALGRERQQDRQRWRVGWVWLSPTPVAPEEASAPSLEMQ